MPPQENKSAPVYKPVQDGTISRIFEKIRNAMIGVQNLKRRVKLIEDFLNQQHEIYYLDEHITITEEGEFEEYVKGKAEANKHRSFNDCK